MWTLRSMLKVRAGTSTLGCRTAVIAFGTLTIAMTGVRLVAQAPLPTPMAPPQSAAPTPPPSAPAGAPLPTFSPSELDRIVSPIALYPDPLLAQVLAAATFPRDIPDAARWADAHHLLTDRTLTNAMALDGVPWEPSVQALVPFPSVLEMMASAMPWTEELGNAFLANPGAVMDAVQRMRQRAYSYGYLGACGGVIVHGGPFLEVLPADPAFIVVPYYDPAVVFAAPAPGFVLARGVYCGFGIRLGAWFAPWGWGTTRFLWATHGVVINNAPWGRTWANRMTYKHPYPTVPGHAGPRPPESHRTQPRTPDERARERSRREGRDGDGRH
jgi:uncharacterized protein DUF3300